MQPCQLYSNPKTARQHLFLAAAALYILTGSDGFKQESDFYFDPNASLFHTNWNNVYPVGVALLAGLNKGGTEADDKARSEYRKHLGRSVQQWAACSADQTPDAPCGCAPCV